MYKRNAKQRNKAKVKNLEDQKENYKATTKKQNEIFELRTVLMTTTHDVRKNDISKLERQLKATDEEVIKYKENIAKLVEDLSQKESIIEELRKKNEKLDRWQAFHEKSRGKEIEDLPG